jgi:hypothetical protein
MMEAVEKVVACNFTGTCIRVDWHGEVIVCIFYKD